MPKRQQVAPLTAQEFGDIASDLIDELNRAASMKPIDIDPRLFAICILPGRGLSVVTTGGLHSPTEEPHKARLLLLACGMGSAHNKTPVLGAFLLYGDEDAPVFIGKTPAGLTLRARVKPRSPDDRLAIADIGKGEPVDGRHPLDAFLIAADPKRQKEAGKMIGESVVALRPKDGEPAVELNPEAVTDYHVMRAYGPR